MAFLHFCYAEKPDFAAGGATGAGPAELGALQKSEVAKWAKLIKASNIKLE